MRTVLIALIALALPSLAAAQEGADIDDHAPRVQVEQTTDGAAAPDLDRVDRADRDVETEDRTRTAEDAAAVQEPGSRQFWYIVLAVVVGGIIVAVLL